MSGNDSTRVLQKRLTYLMEYEHKAIDERASAKKMTICGFPYGRGECSLCMHEKNCADRNSEVEGLAWKKLSRTMVAYNALEKELRAMPEDNMVLDTLARVLRCEAGNATVIGTDDVEKLKEAEELFLKLYYGTGDQSYREESESCRLMGKNLLNKLY